jgi:hypothetical protein
MQDFKMALMLLIHSDKKSSSMDKDYNIKSKRYNSTAKQFIVYRFVPGFDNPPLVR